MLSILIVDSQRLYSRNVADHLRRAGFTTAVAASGVDARDAVARSDWALVCIDVDLPDCSGFDLFQELRLVRPELPVVITSSAEGHGSARRAQRLGARAFFSKPFPLEDFCRKIHGIVERPFPNHPRQPLHTSLIGRERKAMSMLLYSHDGFGLGHLRRTANIASRFVREVPGSSALIVIGCAAGMIFDLPPGVDFIKLPSIKKVGTGKWVPRQLFISAQRTKALRSQLILHTAQQFRPDLVLVDHLPGGVWNEIVPTLRALRRESTPPKVVLGLRDIVDAPEVVRDSWSREGTYELIPELYDEVLIYGNKDVFDTGAQYGLDRVMPGRLHYCGYLCSEPRIETRERARERLGLGDEKLMVVTAGGGHDAFPMMSATLRAVHQLPIAKRPHVIVVTGPLMNREERLELERLAPSPTTQVLASVEDLPSYMCASDLMVTMGGYNTLMEAVWLKKPIIVIPRSGPSREQTMRTRVLSDLGVVRGLSLNAATPWNLASVIDEQLRSTNPHNLSLSVKGLSSVVSRLKRLTGTEQLPPNDESVEPDHTRAMGNAL